MSQLKPTRSLRHFGRLFATPTLAHAQTFDRCVNVSPFAAPGVISCGSKNVSEFVQEHFASSANVSSFARRGSISGNNVSATMYPRLRGP